MKLISEFKEDNLQCIVEKKENGETELKRQQNLEAKDKANQDLISTASKIEEARQKRKEENDKKREEKKRQ